MFAASVFPVSVFPQSIFPPGLEAIALEERPGTGGPLIRQPGRVLRAYPAIRKRLKKKALEEITFPLRATDVSPELLDKVLEEFFEAGKGRRSIERLRELLADQALRIEIFELERQKLLIFLMEEEAIITIIIALSV